MSKTDFNERWRAFAGKIGHNLRKNLWTWNPDGRFDISEQNNRYTTHSMEGVQPKHIGPDFKLVAVYFDPSNTAMLGRLYTYNWVVDLFNYPLLNRVGDVYHFADELTEQVKRCMATIFDEKLNPGTGTACDRCESQLMCLARPHTALS